MYQPDIGIAAIVAGLVMLAMCNLSHGLSRSPRTGHQCLTNPVHMVASNRYGCPTNLVAAADGYIEPLHLRSELFIPVDLNGGECSLVELMCRCMELFR